MAMTSVNSKLPPQNLEAEQSVLGSILIDNQVFHKVIDFLSPEDFYRPANGKIFGGMIELITQSQPIDVLTLSSKLKTLGLYEEVGGAAYVAEILERVPTALNAEYHAKLIRDQATKRNLVSVCNEIASRGLDASETTEELLDYAEKRIFSLSSSKQTRSLVPVRDVVKDAFRELEKRFENQGQMTGVASGYINLDKITQGFQKSDLIIVACRPGMGKTSFSLGVARHAATHVKAPVVFFSLEMAKEQIVSRLLAAEGKVDSTRLRTGKLTEQDWDRLTRGAGRLSESPIYIDDTPALTVLEMRSKARKLKSELGELGLIIVDYLQIMGATNKNDNREKVIADISRSLKALAKELNVPVVALSQLNRQIETRPDKRPMMADLRESGAIEQDADIILFIHREDIENLQPGGISMAEFIIRKHRNGPQGTVKVAWLGQYTSFENLSNQSV